MDDTERNELVELIRRMQCGQSNPEDYPAWLQRIERATGNPHTVGILSSRDYDGMAAEDILSRLMQYRPFLMPPPSP